MIDSYQCYQYLNYYFLVSLEATNFVSSKNVKVYIYYDVILKKVISVPTFSKKVKKKHKYILHIVPHISSEFINYVTYLINCSIVIRNIYLNKINSNWKLALAYFNLFHLLPHHKSNKNHENVIY